MDIVIVREIKTIQTEVLRGKRLEKKWTKASVTYGIILAVIYLGCNTYRRQGLRSWDRKKNNDLKYPKFEEKPLTHISKLANPKQNKNKENKAHNIQIITNQRLWEKF